MSSSHSAPVEGDAREADAPSRDDTQVDSRAVSAAVAAADIDAVQPGARIGRYMVVDVVGSGGIGIVYSAYDPDLDRKVALKLLRRSKAVGASDAVSQRRGRLRREALALARLSHPNVVPVYEVGTFEDQIYVAMEFVEGSTLGEWMSATERTWAEVVALFIQAGRGLAAAHAADIVHRDFKPENVRVGTDGRVRVLDFGLAGPLREGEGDSSERRPEPDSGERNPDERRPRANLDPDYDSTEISAEVSLLSAEVAVTREGQVMGTPAYMAPEQAAGRHVDARSDQFSFCVALYEAIYGARPFSGRHDDPRRYRDLSRARTLPGYRPPDLPNAIERAILRGLSLDPRKRFPNIDALLTELTGVAEGPRRLWMVPVGLVGFALFAVLALLEREHAPSVSCDDGHGLLDGVWDPAVAEELRVAVLRSNKPYADETWATVERSLDDWSQRWRKTRRRACEATHVLGDQSVEMLERRTACLDRQLVRVESMMSALRRLESRPEELLERLTLLLARVPTPEACAAASVFERTGLSPLADADAREAAAIREELAAIEGLTVVGDYVQAVDRARAALDRARELGFEPVTAEALLALGLALEQQGIDRGSAAELLREAAWTAVRSGHERALVRAAAAMAGNIVEAEADLEAAVVWADLARAAFARIGEEPEIEIELRTNLARLAMVRGDYQAALDELERVRTLAHERGPGHPDHLRALRAIGDAQRELGRFDEAAIVLEDAKKLASDELGAEHPMLPDLIDALGNVEASRGHFTEALALHRRSLQINETIYGEHHRNVARSLNNMAIIFDDTGRFGESVETLERARAILVAVHGADHPDVAFVDINLGSALHNLDRDEEAIARYESALSVLEDSFGPEHMAIGVALQNIGTARGALGLHEAALRDFERAELLLRPALGDQHPSVAAVQVMRGESLAALDRHDEALIEYQRALASNEAVFGSSHHKLVPILAAMATTELALEHPGIARDLGKRALSLATEDNTPIERATANYAYAEALVAGGLVSDTDQARARELARTGLRLLADAEGGAEIRAKLRTWLRDHGDSIDEETPPK